MKALIIGGSGTISNAITRLAPTKGIDLYVLNRGKRTSDVPDGVTHLQGDMDNVEEIKDLIKDIKFDIVAEFIAYNKSQLERDFEIFKNKTKQFIFISSASAYQKPPREYVITEGAPLNNPYWGYSKDKIECEKYLMDLYRDEGFPVTIIRPTHTYDERAIPLGVHGDSQRSSWQVARRMLEGKKVIIHGDGTSLWTMTHSSDFAKGFVGIMGNPHCIGESIHITSDEVLTWTQIYESVARALGVELKPVYISSHMLAQLGNNDYLGSLVGDKSNCAIFDNSKIKRLVPEFVATKRFDAGITETIEYILKNKEYQAVDEEFDKWCDDVIKVVEDAISNFRK